MKSAAGTRERLAYAKGVQEVAWDYLSVHLTETQAAQFTTEFKGKYYYKWGWMQDEDACALGPVAYLKNRLLESGFFADWLREDDDILPMVYCSVGRKLVLSICDVARSKMFRTPLRVEPIDLVAMRVSGWNMTDTARHS